MSEGIRRFIAIAEGLAPIVAYHGSDREIERFLPLTHFGTERAARHRITGRKIVDGHLHKVHLNISNPLRVQDNEASDEATLLHARIKGKYPDLDAATLRNQGTVAALKAAGYDGMVYKNALEDRGQDS